ncbi:MAG: serine/threonine protein kinase [Planctomycetes bacterium]|nr:serine/threonine protein kinase [Planctomycetota bacterium]
MGKASDTEFIRKLVQRGLTSLRHVQECLQEAGRCRSRGETADFAALLVRHGFADEEAVRALQAELGMFLIVCPACGKEFPGGIDGDRTARCDRCGGRLLARHGSAGASTPVEGVDTSPPDGDPLLGKIIGGCEIVERIAKGGMGVVYKARQLNLGRTVALKILADGLASDEKFVRRFINEARSAGDLSHGGIVHINDVGRFGDTYFINMEFVDGMNVRQLLDARGSLPVDEAIRIVRQVCEALGHAHKKNTIHRDIKPENIMIARDGVVKVADLGLSKRIAGEDTEGITQPGCVLGTPHYMPPEQARDFKHVDRRSDIYSLGVTFYRMLAGKVPFPGRSPLEVMMKAMQGRKTPIREIRPEVPEELEKVIDRMMNRDPRERFQDMESIVAELDRIAVPGRAAP